MTLRAVERALGITRALGRNGPLTLTEVSRVVDLPKSTTLRFLEALEPNGWIVEDGEGRYRLGPAILAVAGQYMSTDPLVAAATGRMRALRDTVRETVSLSRVADRSRVCVIEFVSPHALRLVLGAGASGPLHAGASGLLLLANLAAERRAELLPPALPAFTSSTITDPARLEAECDRILERGWALTSQQKTLGGVAVAVPVRDHVQGTIAALGIYAPIARFDERRDADVWLGYLRRTAAQIEVDVQLGTGTGP
jgi:IclR family acetate operon transcriptional repressor